MHWSKTELETVLSCRAELFSDETGNEIYFYSFAGSELRYELQVHVHEQKVSLSADCKQSSRSDQIYEIVVPCDRITLIDAPCSTTRHTVICWYGPVDHELNRRLTINKRDDDELSVWPHVPFPEEHPIRRAQHRVEPTG